MADFSHLPVPPERHPTAAARTSLSLRLGFADTQEIQDWERHFADEDRIEEFLVLYALGALDEDEKFLLMDLVLVSTAFADDDALTDDLWQQIEGCLSADFPIHHPSVWYWADIDEETGIADNSFQISRRMQTLLNQQVKRQDPANMTSQSLKFVEFWNTHFPDQEPASFRLRETLRARWVRFHSLPDSQRYAETEPEWETLFERNNALGGAALGAGAKCWLVVCRSVDPTNGEEDAHLARFDLNYCFDWRWEDMPGFHHDFPVFAAEMVWNSGQFNDLIREIALGQEAPIMIISQTTGAIFVPYDGGVDLIFPREDNVAPFRWKYRDWLPTSSSGL